MQVNPPPSALGDDPLIMVQDIAERMRDYAGPIQEGLYRVGTMNEASPWGCAYSRHVIHGVQISVSVCVCVCVFVYT